MSRRARPRTLALPCVGLHAPAHCASCLQAAPPLSAHQSRPQPTSGDTSSRQPSPDSETLVCLCVALGPSGTALRAIRPTGTIRTPSTPPPLTRSCWGRGPPPPSIPGPSRARTGANTSGGAGRGPGERESPPAACTARGSGPAGGPRPPRRATTLPGIPRQAHVASKGNALLRDLTLFIFRPSDSWPPRGPPLPGSSPRRSAVLRERRAGSSARTLGPLAGQRDEATFPGHLPLLNICSPTPGTHLQAQLGRGAAATPRPRGCLSRSRLPCSLALAPCSLAGEPN